MARIEPKALIDKLNTYCRDAMENATGVRFTELPMSPPKVLKALKDRGLNKA